MSARKLYQGIAATETYSPLLELIRFFTPFGAEWQVTVDSDVVLSVVDISCNLKQVKNY
jgi:hypothetical protein